MEIKPKLRSFGEIWAERQENKPRLRSFEQIWSEREAPEEPPKGIVGGAAVEQPSRKVEKERPGVFGALEGPPDWRVGFQTPFGQQPGFRGQDILTQLEEKTRLPVAKRPAPIEEPQTLAAGPLAPSRPAPETMPIGLSERAIKGYLNKTILEAGEKARPTTGVVEAMTWATSEPMQKLMAELPKDPTLWEGIKNIPKIWWAMTKGYYAPKEKKRRIEAEAKLKELRPPITFEVPAAETLGEKATEVGTGLSAFLTQLFVAKKLLPTGTVLPDHVAWEIVNQATGGTPGQGAITRGALGGIGKIPTGSAIGKVAKTSAESGLFASLTAMTGGSTEDIIVSALVPPVFNIWHFQKQKTYLQNYEHGLRQAALDAHYKRIQEGVSEPFSRSYLEIDMRSVSNAVAKAKQKIYSDDAFAPAKEKWEAERQKALKLIAKGGTENRRRGNAILDFMGTTKPAEGGIEMPTTRTAEAVETAREVAEAVRHPVKAIQKAAVPTKPPTMPKAPVIPSAVVPPKVPAPVAPPAAKQPWQMSIPELEVASKGGKISPVSEYVVADVLSGERKIGHVGRVGSEILESEWPEIEKQYREKGLLVEPDPFIKYSEEAGEKYTEGFLVSKDKALLEQAKVKLEEARKLGKEDIRYHQLVGEAFGYSQKDIAKLYLEKAKEALEKREEKTPVPPEKAEVKAAMPEVTEAEGEIIGRSTPRENTAIEGVSIVTEYQVRKTTEAERAEMTKNRIITKPGQGVYVVDKRRVDISPEGREVPAAWERWQMGTSREEAIQHGMGDSAFREAIRKEKPYEPAKPEEAVVEPEPRHEELPRPAAPTVPEQPTGTLDPTKPEDATEIIRLHRESPIEPPVDLEGLTRWQETIGFGSVYREIFDEEGNKTRELLYTAEQVDTAYRTVQMSVPSGQEDVNLFAMPGKEKEVAALAEKMRKMKALAAVKPTTPSIGRPKQLPAASKLRERHVKAVYGAAATEETRYAINGVLVEGENLIATDGRRMFIAKGKWGKDGLYLDTKALKQGLLGKAEKEGPRFPAWKDIIPDHKSEDIILIDDLPLVWRRLQQAKAVQTAESRGVLFLLNKDGSLGFASASPEIGHAEINVQIGAKILGAANPDYILDALAFHAIRGDKSIQLYFPFPDRPILTRATGGSTQTVTMPVGGREPSEELKRAIGEIPEAAKPVPEEKRVTKTIGERAPTVSKAEFLVGDRVTIVAKPSTAHLTDAAEKSGIIVDIQMIRGKPSSWAVKLDDGKEYIVDTLDDMSKAPPPTQPPAEAKKEQVAKTEDEQKRERTPTWGKSQPHYLRTIPSRTAWAKFLHEAKEVGYIDIGYTHSFPVYYHKGRLVRVSDEASYTPSRTIHEVVPSEHGELFHWRQTKEARAIAPKFGAEITTEPTKGYEQKKQWAEATGLRGMPKPTKPIIVQPTIESPITKAEEIGQWEIINNRGQRFMKQTYPTREAAQKVLEKRITSPIARTQFAIEQIAAELPEKPKGPSPAAGSTAAFAAESGYGTIASSEKAKFSEKTEHKRVHAELPKGPGLQIIDNALKIAAPPARGEQARETARVVRKNLGQLAQETVVLHENLRRAHRAFTFMKRDDVYDFIDRMENGQPQKTPSLEQTASEMRRLLDGRRDAVQALGKHYLEQFYEHYFPHIWKNPKGAGDAILRFFTKRRLEGSKAFLKKRTIMTIKEGRELGLELVSENPVDLVLLKLYEMDRFLMAHRIIRDMKDRGLIKFVYSRLKSPDGYIKIDDRAFTVYMPPEITKKEAYDLILVDQLMDIARSLGVDTQRFVAIGGKRWGYAQWPAGAAMEGPHKVRTKYAGPESVLAHEIGHILGAKYNLYETLRRIKEGEFRTVSRGERAGEQKFVPAKEAIEHRKVIDAEWRALADARFKGQQVGPGFKGYVRKVREKEAVMLEALIHAPEEFRRVAPILHDLFTKFLNEHSELRPILDLKPSLVLGQSDAQIKVPGFTVLGHYYAPEPAARILNNYLSPGLRNAENLLIGGGYNMARMGGNVLNQAQLSLSLWHAMDTTIDTMNSTLATGLRKLLTPGQRLSGLGNIISAPLAPALRVWDGVRLRRAYRKQIDTIADPKLRQRVEAVILADGRDRLDPFYYNQAIKSLVQTLGDLIRGRPMERVSAIFKLPFEALQATLEALAKPLMEWYVPSGKMGVFSLMAEHEMQRAMKGQISDEQLHQRLVESWDSVDNRMGELVYDNLFWNKTMKDLLMLSMRSVGWNLGSFREYGGMPVEALNTKQRLNRGDLWLGLKMSYSISSVLLYGMIGSVIMYLLTGRPPEEYKDYFFPKTGRKNPDGSDERLSLPTYAKDWFGFALQPYRQITNKAHPFWGVLTDLAQNKDFFNVEIRDPKDPFSRQMLDVAKHITSEFLPLSLRNYQKMQKAAPAQTSKNFWVSLTGVTSAPQYITRSPAQKLMYRYIVEEIPDKPIPKEQFEIRMYRNNLRALLRKGTPVNAKEAKRKIGIEEWNRLLKEVQTEPFSAAFEKLDTYEAMHVWSLANDKERPLIEPILKRKLATKTYQLSSPEAKPSEIEKMREYKEVYGFTDERAKALMPQETLPEHMQRTIRDLGAELSLPSRRVGKLYLTDKQYEFYINETVRNIRANLAKSTPKSKEGFELRMNKAKDKARSSLKRKVNAGEL